MPGIDFRETDGVELLRETLVSVEPSQTVSVGILPVASVLGCYNHNGLTIRATPFLPSSGFFDDIRHVRWRYSLVARYNLELLVVMKITNYRQGELAITRQPVFNVGPCD